MLIRVDPANERPIYAQIADTVRLGIATGQLREGEMLPPAREVASGLGINAHTVLHAYQLLRDEGLVDLRRGRGASVTGAAQALGELRREALVLVRRSQELGVSPEMLAAIITGAAAAPVPGLEEDRP